MYELVKIYNVNLRNINAWSHARATHTMHARGGATRVIPEKRHQDTIRGRRAMWRPRMQAACAQ